jgi:hypothetical protein
VAERYKEREREDVLGNSTRRETLRESISLRMAVSTLTSEMTSTV